MDTRTPDAIEHDLHLDAPPERVWRAIGDADAFGRWSGMTFDGPFVAHARLGAHLTAAAGGGDTVPVEWKIGRIEPGHLLEFFWHPFPADPHRDYSGEPHNTVTFELAPSGSGTSLKISERGFHGIPEDRRAEAFAGNRKGWDMQLKNLKAYLER